MEPVRVPNESTLQRSHRSTEGSPRSRSHRFNPYSPSNTSSCGSPQETLVQRETAETFQNKSQPAYFGQLRTPPTEENFMLSSIHAWQCSTSPLLSSSAVEDFDGIATAASSMTISSYPSPRVQLQPDAFLAHNALGPIDSSGTGNNTVGSGEHGHPVLTPMVDAASTLITPPSEHNGPSVPPLLDLSLSTRSTNDVSHFPRSSEPETNDAEPSILSVSTAFHPGSLPHLPPPDVIIISADGTLFYTHASTLLSAAPHVFHSFLTNLDITYATPSPDGAIAPTSFETSTWVVQRYLPAGSSTTHVWLKLDIFPADELNVMLHAFYNTSCAAHQPSIDVVDSVLSKLSQHFSLDINHLVPPSSALFAYLLGLAPLYPLRVYTIGAKYGIHQLAVKASSHLLSFPLSSLTDDQAVSIGAVYLKKLVLLHVGRAERLRDLLLKPPLPHAPTKACGFKDQKTLEGLWASVVVNLAWDVRPDLSTVSLHRALNPVISRLDCGLCRESLDTRITDIIKQWASVHHCIS